MASTPLSPALAGGKNVSPASPLLLESRIFLSSLKSEVLCSIASVHAVLHPVYQLKHVIILKNEKNTPLLLDRQRYDIVIQVFPYNTLSCGGAFASFSFLFIVSKLIVRDSRFPLHLNFAFS